jgi:glycosyltransferase involved in cell wall biosynthesis
VRVGLDVTPAITTHGGLARYTVELWRELANRDDVVVRAFAVGRGAKTALALPVRRLHVPLRALRPLWRAAGWPRVESFVGSVDVAHSLALTPVPSRAPQIVTLHDVLPVSHPELYPRATVSRFRAELAGARRASVVVTTCHATAAEISRVAGIPPERIQVAPPGFARLPPNGPSTLTAEPYVLAVGQITPRKGLDVLAAAAAILEERCPRILVAGPDWWRAGDVRAAIAAHDHLHRIRILGSVDDETLAALYRGATLVCHTSRAEGFGLPCLEAMSQGTPVVATDLPSVRELADGAAVLVPVDNAEALASAISGLLDDPERRARLAQSGRQRAVQFSWSRTADAVVDAYRRAVEQ